ncbi:Putative cyclin PHO80 [Septoria linicola]|uniref:Cyclin PHO80 n=1 Tax=Septoria linicola TaxID=215465 RepID=A0A9Q9EEB2_9PEZI|nr:putative cyclin PHO80 [Septoria linicola]USW47700.1 Putative cyclin PHO80 [Septoria linicola]
MNTGAELRSSDGHGPNLTGYGPYEASIASSASSSQASIFSDPLSASSSIATSISDDFRSSQEDAQEQERGCTQAQSQSHAHNQGNVHLGLFKAGQQCPTYADVTSVPAPQRCHNPRRSSLSRAHRPPPLVRQRDRKVNFVDNLVDSATQMVEVIWPLSVVPCRAETNGRGVLPLRTYIEETLKRSRTSYSTLQVALYYLVLIRPHVPENDFTMEQSVDSATERALMCGRRMFLCALILASKYLQDRNYSAKAWSKMSGLKVSEINANERNFLSKIDWKLHIPKPAFEKWQEIVLRYSPNAPPSPGWNTTSGCSMWKRIIPLLTADLDTLPMAESKMSPENEGFSGFDLASPTTPTPASIQSTITLRPIDSTLQETTPTPATVLPRYLEPSPNVLPPMPTLARMGPLPTPSMTPQSTATGTPAASVCGSRKSSMSSAMAIAQRQAYNTCLLDNANLDPRITHVRRPSIGSTNSYDSPSPESMMSDHSRSSRASSISSVSTASTSSSMAPRACLARQATCRNAGLLSTRTTKEEPGESAMAPIVIDDDVEMSSPMMADFSVSEKILHAPHRHSRGPKHSSSQPTTVPSIEKSKKRGRTHGHRRSVLQEEVRHLLEESLDDDEMDLDDRVSPAPTSSYASNLSRGPNVVSFRDVQPPASLGGWSYGRVPVQQHDGRKRICAMSISPVPLYGEVV